MDRLFRRESSFLGAFVAVLFVLAACTGKRPEGPHRSAPTNAGEGGGGSGDVEPTAGTPGDSMGSGGSDGGAPDHGPANPLIPKGEPCNGREAYCALTYDQVCFAVTHDSAANSRDYWEVPVQDRSIIKQLQGGIRALSLSVFDDHGSAAVCRNRCEEGNTPLAVVLGDVAKFLDENPREVVTLIVDSDLGAAALSSEFAAKGLDARSLAQNPAEAWPTLGAMIDAETRLVVFTATADSGPAWLLPRQTFLWETGRDWPSLAAMTCRPEVGSEASPLYLVHHNLVAAGDDQAVPNAELAAKANALAVVTARLESCRAQYARTPNFVAVDFSSEGNVIDATQVLNGDRAR